MLNIEPHFIGRQDLLEEVSQVFSDNSSPESYFVIYGSNGQGMSRIGEELNKILGVPLFINVTFNEFNRKVPLSGIKQILNTYFNILDQSISLKNIFVNLITRGIKENNFALLQTIPKLKEYVPQTEQSRNLHVLLKVLFLNLSNKEIPLILFLDDIHYCDKASLEILSNIVGANSSIFSIMTCERKHKNNINFLLEKIENSNLKLHKYELENFNEKEMILYFKTIFVNSLFSPEKLAKILILKIPATPLILMEAIKLLIQKGHIFYNETWEYCEDDIINETLPNKISELLITRTEELQKDEILILKYCSAIGKSFDFRLLETLSFKNPDLYDYNDITSTLRNAKDKGIIEEIDQGLFTFSSIEVKDYLYNLLDSEDKAIFHNLCAQYIEENYSLSDNAIFELAYHYSRTDNLEKGIEYLKLAAEKSRESFARHEALEYSELALDSIKYLPDSEEHKKIKHEITFNYLHSLKTTGNHSKGFQLLDNIKNDIETSGDKEKIAQLYYWYGEINYLEGDHLKAFQFFMRCIPIAEETNLTQMLVKPYIIVGGTFFFTGNFFEGLKYLEKSFEYIKKDDYDHLCRAYAMTGWCYTGIGYRKKALEYVIKAEFYLKYVSDIDLKITTYHTIGSTYGWYGNKEKNIEYAKKVIEEAQKIENHVMVYSGIFGYSFAFLRAGMYEDAIKHVKRALKYAEEHNLKIGLHYAYGCYAESLLQLGQYEEAIKNAKIGLEITEGINNYFFSSEFSRIIGACYYRGNEVNIDKAKDYLEKAVDYAKKAEIPSCDVLTYGEYSAFLYTMNETEKALEYEKKFKEALNKGEMEWERDQVLPHIEKAKKSLIKQKKIITPTNINNVEKENVKPVEFQKPQINDTVKPNIKTENVNDISDAIYSLKPIIENMLELFCTDSKEILLETFFNSLYSYSNFERGFLYLINNGKMVCTGGMDYKGNDISQENNQICRQSIRNAILKKNNVYIIDASNDADYKLYSSVYKRKIKSIYVSIIEDKRANSILYLESLNDISEIDGKTKEMINYLQHITSSLHFS